MIENAGLGIIIGNSALSKKQLNKIIVKDNDADGVAEAIKKYILWQKLQKYYKKTTNSLQKKIKTCIISRYVV